MKRPNHIVAYVLVIAAALFGIHVTEQHSVCEVHRTAWSYAHGEVVALTAPLDVNDPLLTAQQRALRSGTNQDRAMTRQHLLHALGKEPSC